MPGKGKIMKKLITTSLVALGLATSINAGELKYFAGSIKCNHADYKPKKYAKATVFVFKGYTTDEYHRQTIAKDIGADKLYYDMKTALNDIESDNIAKYCRNGDLRFTDYDKYHFSHGITPYYSKSEARKAFSEALSNNKTGTLIKKRIKVKKWIDLDKYNDDL
jgi:hypothetical protein